MLRKNESEFVNTTCTELQAKCRIKSTTRKDVLVRIDEQVRMQRSTYPQILVVFDLFLMSERDIRTQPMSKDGCQITSLVDVHPPFERLASGQFGRRSENSNHAVSKAGVENPSDRDAVFVEESGCIAVTAVKHLDD